MIYIKSCDGYLSIGTGEQIQWGAKESASSFTKAAADRLMLDGLRVSSSGLSGDVTLCLGDALPVAGRGLGPERRACPRHHLDPGVPLVSALALRADVAAHEDHLGRGRETLTQDPRARHGVDREVPAQALARGGGFVRTLPRIGLEACADRVERFVVVVHGLRLRDSLGERVAGRHRDRTTGSIPPGVHTMAPQSQRVPTGMGRVEPADQNQICPFSEHPPADKTKPLAP